MGAPKLGGRDTTKSTMRTLSTSRAVLNGKKKVFRYTVFPKKPAGTSCVQPWLVAVGGWQLAVGGGWWRLVVDDWWLVVPWSAP